MLWTDNVWTFNKKKIKGKGLGQQVIGFFRGGIQILRKVFEGFLTIVSYGSKLEILSPIFTNA